MQTETMISSLLPTALAGLGYLCGGVFIGTIMAEITNADVSAPSSRLKDANTYAVLAGSPLALLSFCAGEFLVLLDTGALAALHWPLALGSVIVTHLWSMYTLKP